MIVENEIKLIVEKNIAPDGYRTVWIGTPHKIVNKQFIYKQNIENLIQELCKYIYEK